MKQNQQKKVALVTGASSGMGKEIAKQLMTDGYRVYAAARQVDQMNDLAELGVLPVRLDISEPNEIESLASTILGEVGRIDVLVNNAGFGLYGAVEDVGIEEARHQFEVNLFGLARLTQLLLPAMREKKSGNIVNISSMGGKVYTPLGAWYHATKHALEGWSDCLRLELAPFGIRVVIIEPGLIETGFDRNRVWRSVGRETPQAIRHWSICQNDGGGGPINPRGLWAGTRHRPESDRQFSMRSRQGPPTKNTLRRRQVCQADDFDPEMARGPHVRSDHHKSDAIKSHPTKQQII